MCLGACLLHNVTISFVSEYPNHSSVRCVSTHQAISLGQKLVHVHYSEKHLMEQVVYNFGAKKNTKFFVTVKGNLVFSIIVTTRC